MKNRVLITGGAGFLGRHLCKRLLNEGNYVICMDNLSTGNKENIEDLLKDRSFEFLEWDILDPFKIWADQIYNLACPASPIHYQTDPIKTMKTSVIGAINILELSKDTGVRILQTSTSEVYGDPEKHPQKESYFGNVNPIGIRACYDEGKRCAETLFFDYHRQHKLDIRVVRIFNTYGPYMHPNDGRVVSNFIIQALLKEDITIYGDGSQTRSFCYVDDMVEGLIKMMNTDDITGPVNLGNPNEITILELAKIILKLIKNNKSDIITLDLPSDDPKIRKPDISIAKNRLDWNPEVNLREGLVKTINYFSKLI